MPTKDDNATEATVPTEATEGTDPGTTAPVDNPDAPPVAAEQADPPTTDSNPADSVVEDGDSDQDFAERQASLAAAQGVPGGVPEIRPQAFSQVDAPSSPLSERIASEQQVDTSKPMPKSAYDAASDPERKARTAKEGILPGILPGTVLDVTEGINRDRTCAVTRVVSYASDVDLLHAQSAQNELANVAQPAELEVRFRGDDRDGEMAVLNLVDPNSPEYAVVNVRQAGFGGRKFMAGQI